MSGKAQNESLGAAAAIRKRNGEGLALSRMENLLNMARWLG